MTAHLATLLARQITVTHGRRPSLTDIDLTVAPGHRIGVVGPNGVGKSTLLRVLAGIERPEKGTVTLAPPDAAVGFLPQEPERRVGETVGAFLARRTGVAAATTELDGASAAVGRAEPGADHRYGAALERWLALGGPEFDARAGATWADLGLASSLLDRPMITLSGGQAAGRAGRHPPQPVRPVPPGRADQRPRPRRPGPGWRRSSSASAPGWSWSATTGPSRSGR
jgi:ATPase subunit of ABC transporter with duplicated ATPase domains